MSWDTYFPMAAGAELSLEVKVSILSVKGKAHVREKTDTVLSFDFLVPKQSILFQTVPETRGSATVTYVQDGAGNKIEVDFNGEQLDDDDLSIHSDAADNTRRLATSGAYRGRQVKLSMRGNGADSATIFDIEGFPGAGAATIILSDV